MPRITAQQYREFRAWKPKLLTQVFSDGGGTESRDQSSSTVRENHPSQPDYYIGTSDDHDSPNQESDGESIANYSNSYEIIGLSSHPGFNPNYEFETQPFNPGSEISSFAPLSLEDIFAQTQAQSTVSNSILDQKLKIGGLCLKPIVNNLLVQEYQKLGTVLKVTQQHLQSAQQYARQVQKEFKEQLIKKDEQILNSQLEHKTLAKHQEHLRDQLGQLKNLQKELESGALRYQRLQNEYQVLTDRHLRQTQDLRIATDQAKTHESDALVVKQQLKMVLQQVHELQQTLARAEKHMTMLDNKYQLEHKLRLSQETEIKDLLARLKKSQAIADMEKTLRQKSDQRADFAVKTRQITEEQLFQLFSSQETQKLN